MLRNMSRVAGADGGAGSTTNLWGLRNSTFRSIWLATQVSSLGWLMQTVAIQLADGDDLDFRSDGGAGPGFIEPADFQFVRLRRGSRRKFQPSPGHVRRPLPYE